MKRPEPTWETEYRHDRRKHRHRCRACDRIIQDGERVLMARVKKGSAAVHIECAGSPVIGTSFTYRDSMTAWGLAGLKARGWHVPELETRIA